MSRKKYFVVVLTVICILASFNISFAKNSSISKINEEHIGLRELVPIKEAKIINYPQMISDNKKELTGLKVLIVYEDDWQEIIDNTDNRINILSHTTDDDTDNRYDLYIIDKDEKIFLGELKNSYESSRGTTTNRGIKYEWQDLELNSYPNKLVYLVGEDYSLEGFSFTIVCEDFDEYIEYNSETADYFTVENYDKNTEGKQFVTVIFDNNKYSEEISWDFDIVVKQDLNDKIVINTLCGKSPNKYYYEFGEKLDFTGRKNCVCL